MGTPGYAGRILRMDLSSQRVDELPTSDYAGNFCGGRGFAARLYWDAVKPEASALDPGNLLVFATGPLAGVPVIGGSRWQVCGKSPAAKPHHFSYSNLGGRWGASLKFSGYDAVAVQGRSERPVYVLINDDGVNLRDASALWGRGAIDTREALKAELGDTARVAAIGPAGENLAVMATILADQDSSGSGGLGASMGAKNLKAVVVTSARRGTEVAHPERLQELISYYRGLVRLPLNASIYRYSEELVPSFGRAKMKKADPCYGCRGCTRRLYEAEDGKKGKFMCASALFYQPWVVHHHGGWKDDVAFYATKMIDDYGLDSKAIDHTIGWLHACYRAGILTDEDTGMPISRAGSLEFIEALTRKIAFREGFGDLLASGIHAAAESLGREVVELADGVGYLGMPEYELLYDPRLYIPHAMFYAMEPRLPMSQLHEYGVLMPKFAAWAKGIPDAKASPEVVRAIARRFWGSEVAADLSRYEGKAMAAKRIQDRETAKECLVLCDMLWPIVDLYDTEDHVGDPTLESRLLSTVTGMDIDEEGLNRIGERVFNLQRAILVMEGHRGRDFDQPPGRCFTDPLRFDQVNQDCVVPGGNWEPVSRKGMTLDRGSFEKMKDEYYQLRGWDVGTGLQTKAALEGLGLGDVAGDLESRGLLAK
jgi:aldehyde:ferredoxin oxidoreductase